MVDMCPGLVLEKHVLSAEQLRNHAPAVYAWPPPDLFAAILTDGCEAMLLNPITGNKESFLQLICLGSKEVSFFYII